MSDAASQSRWGQPGEVMMKLSGTWSFDRTIEGHGSMQGVASFTRLDQDRLAYREEGNLRLLDGTELQAEREYIYRVRRDGFDVFFKESPPRLFHEVFVARHQGSEYGGTAEHLCGRDTYQSTYRFLPSGNFVIRHIVHGPRKDYTMITTYSRAWNSSGVTLICMSAR
jgi:uncharacterized protein DUF6314